MSYALVINGTPVTTFDLKGSQTKKVMGENVINLTFSTTAYLDIPLGTTLTVYGEDYRLNKLATWEKKGERHYNYSMQLESVTNDLINYQYLFYNELNEPSESQFTLMSDASGFIDLLIANANRVSPGWTKGEVDVTAFKNLTFSEEKCLQVLNRLAQEYDTEFFIEGKVINFTRQIQASGLSLAYGQGNGLYTITRQNKDENVVTRLYAFGSSRNIPGNYRNFSTRLKMPVATGVYIEQNVAEYGVIEHTEIFEDIYPHREGTVTGVDAGNPLVFTDTAMDFDVNAQLLPGVTAKAIFNTGLLAGYEFEISGYSHGTKTFTLNINKDEKALEMPSASFRPAIGDKYTLVDLEMPSTYITIAEEDLQAAAELYLTKNSNPRVVYSVATDSFHFSDEGVTLVLGNTVNITDTAAGVNENPRIISYTRDINNPYLYTSLELSESVAVAGIVKQFARQEAVIKAMAMNNLFDPNRARNSWRNSQELLNLVFDGDGFFTDKIRPLSIETASLSVGARSQQFQLNGVLMQPNFGGDDHRFVSDAGTLDHFTIDPDGIKTWNIAASDVSGLANTAFYIYAKCEKAGTSGTVLLSTTPFKVDEDATYYHFLIGILHSSI